ncbi:polysaccharide pyruvyl transferase family protein [Microbacterium azadirachtae]|uniref:polysaccharide pyruvyl transferase family protein n=1 Tax=Microbacterium azadirachtae TaxID=582680 RepID=UPI00088CE5F7|nr:polysaccharide pyruvyl transferase family protein [Microbacterium azadirachtae]SDM42390.1 Polysaccharide pyruvyl transferase [Microbacterium azadirachtae]SEG57645.1 Polysaccharide pyruvyl transferase [Microbacterium azadirachtae]SEG60614.1 Polysaccharide pyruvyl transferase [Microbacterium azadirachtae]
MTGAGGYDSPLRRRLRQARRILQAAPAVGVRGVVVPAFWWDGHPNFGDALTPLLLPRYGIVPLHREPDRARLAGVGSIIQFLPDRFDGAVWGSGSIDDAERRLPSAHVLAVRGPLTAERIGAEGVAYGDPGLLVGRHLKRPGSDGRVVLVAHGHHRRDEELLRFEAAAGVRAVNVHRPAPGVLRGIASADAVLTTSLHGLVTADAYGIPAVWTTREPALIGGDFKFRDYEAAVTPGRSRFVSFEDLRTPDDVVRRARAADAARVTALCDGLESALRRLPEVLGALPRYPAGALHR